MLLNKKLSLSQVTSLSSIYIQKRCIQRPALNTTQLTVGKRPGALALKVGMLPLWDKWGERHAVTVLHMDDVVVVQSKTMETDGYKAVQLGIGEAKKKRVNKPLTGHYNKADLDPKRKLSEFRVSEDINLPVGTKIGAMHFVPGQYIDVCGISKGKGFAGVMKRWNFGGGRASHGNSLAHRIPGSTGCRQDPGKVFKNKKMPGRLGGERTTIQNLQVVKIDPVRDLLFVKGGVPGPKGSFLRIVDAVKGPFHPAPPPVPTFVGEIPIDQLFMPIPDEDRGKLKEPDDPY